MAKYKPKVLIGLDRDGTINHDPGYLGKRDDWQERTKILPKVVEGIKAMKQIPGVQIAVCTNQAGVARGYFPPDKVREVNKHINSLLERAGAGIETWHFCPFVDPTYAAEHQILRGTHWIVETDLRKPGIGMLRKAASDVGMKLEDYSCIVTVGDKLTDVEMGLFAKGRGIYVGDDEETKKRVLALGGLKQNEGRVFVASDLEDAAEQIKLIVKLARNF